MKRTFGVLAFMKYEVLCIFYLRVGWFDDIYKWIKKHKS